MLGIVVTLVAALLPTYALWRVGQGVCVWTKHPHAPRIVPHVLALTVAIPLAAWGQANGGPPAWGWAFSHYVPAQTIWFAYDHWREMRRQSERAEAPSRGDPI